MLHGQRWLLLLKPSAISHRPTSRITMPKPQLVRRRTDGDMPATFTLALSPRLGTAAPTASRPKTLKRGGSNGSNGSNHSRPMPLLPYQLSKEPQVLPEVTSPGSFKVDVSVPESCLPNPKALLRRSTLPALDLRSEALMLSRQLHLDFHEVKFVLQEIRESQHLPNGGMEYTTFQECLQRICGVELLEEWVAGAYKECRGSEGPVDSERILIWYRDHIFNLEAYKLKRRLCLDKPGASQVTLDLARKFHCSCLDLDKMKVKFDDFDLDKSGYIDHDEFEKMMYQLLRSSKSDFPKSRLTRFWNEADKNGDGIIDFEEFLEWYMKYFGTSYENGPMDAFYASFMPGVQRSNSCKSLDMKTHGINLQPIKAR